MCFLWLSYTSSQQTKIPSNWLLFHIDCQPMGERWMTLVSVTCLGRVRILWGIISVIRPSVHQPFFLWSNPFPYTGCFLLHLLQMAFENIVVKGKIAQPYSIIKLSFIENCFQSVFFVFVKKTNNITHFPTMFSNWYEYHNCCLSRFNMIYFHSRQH